MDTRPGTSIHENTSADTALEQATTIFDGAWKQIRARIESGAVRLPREIIWLGGAPGAGKGTNTPFILRERGIVAPPIVTSDLLNTPEMRRLKDSGILVGDADVVRILFERLIEPAHTTGVVVDGFPRTRVQVECVKLLYQQMLDLRARYGGTPMAPLFPKPMFQIVVLYVEEKESVERQLKRGREIVAHNERVRETGVGTLLEERVTDLNEESCRKRYRVFMEQTYSVLQSLKEVFHFHIINAQGDIASVERAIMREFQYQSSLELDEETFDAIRRIPLATEIVVAARQRLVERLERYQRDSPDLFRRVIATIEADFVPALSAARHHGPREDHERQHAVRGSAGPVDARGRAQRARLPDVRHGRDARGALARRPGHLRRRLHAEAPLQVRDQVRRLAHPPRNLAPVFRFDILAALCVPRHPRATRPSARFPTTACGRSCGGSATGTTCRCWCSRRGRWPAGRWRAWLPKGPATRTSGPTRRRSLLGAFDEAGITAMFVDPEHGGFIEGPKNFALALVAFELAWVDAGAATCSLAQVLAVAPIHERGTPEQRAAYMGRIVPPPPGEDRRHVARRVLPDRADSLRRRGNGPARRQGARGRVARGRDARAASGQARALHHEHGASPTS